MRGRNLRVWPVGLVLVLWLAGGCQVLREGQADHQGKTMTWSGYKWFIKEAAVPQGPGPNYFSSSSRNVWVDDQGFLHLRIRKENDTWYCAEIIATKPLGYGTYTLELASRADHLDDHAVLGFFTWKPRSLWYHNEIDIELSSWGKSLGPNAQYVVQPHYYPGHMHRFHMIQYGDYTTHQFSWYPGMVRFSSYHGHGEQPSPQRMISDWTFTGFRVPGTRKTHVRVNFWLHKPQGLHEGEEAEVVIRSFRFTPWY